jgi:hypothetical protein
METHGNKQLTLDQAYQAAYLWLDHIGDPPLEISEPAHGAVELVTEDAFVRVRSSDSPVEQSSVLALLRAAHTGKRLVIFSPSGFSTGAKSIAETQGIALYTLDARGRALPETTHARSIAPDSEPEPPFTPAARPTDDDYWSGFRANQPSGSASLGQSTDAGTQAGAGDWADCPNCGVTHYRNANFCRECGTDLTDHQHSVTEASDSTMPPTFGIDTGTQHNADTGLRCRTCGSHDIELIE